MRVLWKHASVARRALRSAELSSKLAEACCTQGPFHAPCALSLRCLHASAATSASNKDNEQNGNRDDNGNRLPENATAKEMRQWADRMLGRSAQQATLAEASAPAAGELAQMEQEIEEDASREEQLYSKVQAVQENEAEDDAFREERSFDRAHAPGPSLSADSGSEVPSEAAAQQQEEESRETGVADDLGLSEELDDGEYQEAAAATRTVQGMPGVMESQSKAAESGAAQVAAERVQGAQSEVQEEQKWQSFMAEHFGTEMASVLDVKRLRKEEPPPPRSAQSRIFDIKDPRKELDKLLPEEFRRFDVADKSYVKSQAGSYSAQAASEPPPRRITVMEPPVDHRADPVTGYAKLGYAGQSEDALEKMPDKFMERQEYLDKMRKISAQQRIHPTRTFYPGQTYQPEDLAPDAAPGAVAWQLPASVKPSARVKKASNATVRAQADFRNQTFLNTFISELGKLPPKRTTRLQQKTHRHLCRQIKLARQMALLPIDSRLKPSYLARAGGLAEVPSTIEDNPVLAHLLPPHRRPAPREF